MDCYGQKGNGIERLLGPGTWFGGRDMRQCAGVINNLEIYFRAVLIKLNLGWWDGWVVGHLEG